MYLFESIVFSCIYILFPLLVYLIINSYCKSINQRTYSILFEISLFTSLYLILRQKEGISLIYPMTLVNIPLLLSYLKRKTKSSIIISLIIIYYCHNTLNYSFLILIVEYLIYFIIYSYILKKKLSFIKLITPFVFVKSFFLALKVSIVSKLSLILIIELISTMSIFILVTYFCIFIFKKGEEVLDLNSVFNELEKEKSLRNSLFKITHEIKNPIAVCKGYLDMIDYSNEEKTKEYIEIVKDQIKRTLILMDDFLDYTKVTINKEDVDLYMLLEDSCIVSKPLFKKAGIRLDFDIKDEEIYLDLDYNRMKQVFVNIFKNSIEARDNKKEEKYIKMSLQKSSDFVTIKIKDNGIGMDKKTLSKVDEMFYTTKEKGTGLGVALSKEIIELHKGSIKYSSVKNKYTIVTIKLPYK